MIGGYCPPLSKHFRFQRIEIWSFGFKLFNNCLKLNSNISHFFEDVSAAWTFCTKSNALPAPKETILHFFINCPTTVEFVSDHFRNFLENTNVQFNQKYMLVGAPNNITETLATLK